MQLASSNQRAEGPSVGVLPGGPPADRAPLNERGCGAGILDEVISHELQLSARASKHPHLQQGDPSSSNLDGMGAPAFEFPEEGAGTDEDTSERGRCLSGARRLAQLSSSAGGQQLPRGGVVDPLMRTLPAWSAISVARMRASFGFQELCGGETIRTLAQAGGPAS